MGAHRRYQLITGLTKLTEHPSRLYIPGWSLQGPSPSCFPPRFLEKISRFTKRGEGQTNVERTAFSGYASAALPRLADAAEAVHQGFQLASALELVGIPEEECDALP